MNIVYKRTQTQRDAVIARAEKVLAHGQIVGVEGALARWFAGKSDPASLEKIAAVGQWLSQVDPIGYGRTYRLFANSDDAFVGAIARTDHARTLPNRRRRSQLHASHVPPNGSGDAEWFGKDCPWRGPHDGLYLPR